VIADNCLQASMFLRTASSRPDKCLCPSFNIDCIPYGCIENPISLSLSDFSLLFFYRETKNPSPRTERKKLEKSFSKVLRPLLCSVVCANGCKGSRQYALETLILKVSQRLYVVVSSFVGLTKCRYMLNLLK